MIGKGLTSIVNCDIIKSQKRKEVTAMEKLAIVGMIVVLMFTMCAMVAHAEVYPNAGIITKIDEELDLVYVTTLFDGNEWVFEGIEDFSVGDIVAMIMDDVGTEWIVDDVIVTVRYLGWVA